MKNGRDGDLLRIVSRMDHFGQVLDRQRQVEKLVHTDVCVAHLRLLQAQHDMTRKDLIVHDHSEDVTPLVEDTTRWDRHVRKLEVCSCYHCPFKILSREEGHSNFSLFSVRIATLKRQECYDSSISLLSVKVSEQAVVPLSTKSRNNKFLNFKLS